MNQVTTSRDIVRGYGNEERPVTKVLWERDSHTPNLMMTDPGNYEPDRAFTDFKRYYDVDYFKQELEKVWLKSWLFACRDEDIPNVGDRVPLEVGPHSFFIIRSAPDEFKAFRNSCLHRGTELCSKPESGSSIKCPYHAWEWKVDGTLRRIPSHWDFPHVTKKNGSLPEIRLDRWGGFIFVNADVDGSVPLLDALGPVPDHFKDYNYEGRYTYARYRKTVNANWKIAQEAFEESYHVIATHPQAVPYNGDSQSQYDIWTNEHGHVGRQVTPSAVPSMHAPADATPLAAADVYAMIMKEWHYPDAELPKLDASKDLRAQLAAWHREQLSKTTGRNVDHKPDAEMIDSSLYFVFPHMTFWLSESLPFTYQFLPHPTDPGISYFDVRMLKEVPEGQPRPPSSPIIEVGADETIEEKAPLFSYLGPVFDQDMANMPRIQKGIRSADPKAPVARLSRYQEMIIQHWHDVQDRMMES